VTVCVGQILALAGYSAVPALLPQFVSIWSLNNTQAGSQARSMPATWQRSFRWWR
jgi:hypothetical protein